MMENAKGALQPLEANNILHNDGNPWQDNQRIVYIEVEYVKENMQTNGTIPSQPLYSQFEPSVISLDQNLAPVSSFASVFSNEHHDYNQSIGLKPLKDSSDELNGFVPLVNNNLGVHLNNSNGQLGNEVLKNPDLALGDEQEVDILITDQSTGLSYIVERCLNDSRLLESDSFLDTDLLSLDDNVLKNQLNGIIIEPNEESVVERDKNGESGGVGKEPQLDLFLDNESGPCVQQICDRPILSRAWASLPETHLVIKKNQFGECSVFAKKFIPMRTQFGPLEGVLLMENIKQNEDQLHLSIEVNGVFHLLDVSNENHSNWMSFVQPAQKFSEQNLIITQHENNLYFITTRNILPKQELLVGYGKKYAQLRNLPILEQYPNESDLWSCCECSMQFTSSEHFFKHLDEHDAHAELIKKKKRKEEEAVGENECVECTLCKEKFNNRDENQTIKQHLLMQHGVEAEDIERYFIPKFKNDENKCENSQNQNIKSEQNNENKKESKNYKKQYKCPVCPKVFASSDRIQNHILVHGSNEAKPLQCEKCNKRFLNNSALACHLKTHLLGLKIFECPICNEGFHHVLQLKTHVPQHAVDGTYTCPHCKKVFKKYSIVRKHIRAFHCDKKFNCRDCPKSFPTVDKLRMHRLTHSDHREFLCADCGKQFKRKDKLKEHCKKIHIEQSELENSNPKLRKLSPRAEPSSDYYRFIYKCHRCLVGFKRRGMLVNHLAKRHPDVSPESVPELNLPILRATRDYYCNYCDKVYKSSSKRKAHILKNHPGLDLPMSNRKLESLKGAVQEDANPTFSQTVGSVTTHPQACRWCHKQYASKAKLLQHQRKKHADKLNEIGDSLLDRDCFDGGKLSGGEMIDDVEREISERELGEINGKSLICDADFDKESSKSVEKNIIGDDNKISNENLMLPRQQLEAGPYFQCVSIDGNVHNGVEQQEQQQDINDSRLYDFVNIQNNLVPPR